MTVQTSSTNFEYIPVIDGLRAVAIIPVVLYHADLAFINSGFIGVDIFFVISGYLITRVILNDIANENFSFQVFFLRRLRRLFPALAVMSVITTALSIVLLSPSALVDYGKSLVALTLSVSNYYFAMSGGYFADYVSAKPMLHTWSLAVEEQFYLFLPWFLFFTIKYWRLLITLVVILTALSFTLAVIFHDRYSHYVFFSLPTRAWELGLGVIPALCQQRLSIFSPVLKRFATIAGFIMICVSFVYVTELVATPGVSTLLPVFGATLMLVGADEPGIINTILKQKFIVFIGLISYSLYIWHQPIFSLFSELNNFILLIITVLISFVSWKYVEKPFRYSRIEGQVLVRLFILWVVLSTTTGLVIVHKEGFIDRFPSYRDFKEISAWPQYFYSTDECEKIYGNNQFCTVYDSEVPITDALLGDSIANHFSLGLGSYLTVLNKNLVNLGAGGCPPLLNVSTGYHPVHGRNLKCYERTSSAYEAVLMDPVIERVFISFSQYSLFDSTLSYSDNLLEFDFENDRYAAVLGTLMRTIRTYEAKGKTVILIRDLPNVSHNSLKKCLLAGGDLDACTGKLTLLEEEPQYIKLLEDLNALGVNILNTEDLLAQFPYTTYGDLLYRDGTHLSQKGSVFVSEKILGQLDEFISR